MKKIIQIMISVIFMISTINICYATDEKISKDSFEIQARAAVLIDAKSKTVLYSKNMNDRLEPASITKILTTYIGAETLDMDKYVTVSDEAIDLIPRYASHLALDYDEEMKIIDLMYGVMLPSANDAANVIAEEVSGDIDVFADLMNQYVDELGLENTHFTNPHGLPDPDHYTSAYDMAIITTLAIQNDLFNEIYSTRSYTTETTNKKDVPRIIANGNQMIQRGEYNYEYAVGGKTGYTDEAGFTAVTVCEKDGLTLIGVVLDNDNEDERYADLENLFDYGFSNYAELKFENTEVEDVVFDYEDRIKTFSLNHDLHVLVPIEQKDSVLTHELILNESENPEESNVTMYLYLEGNKISELELDLYVEMKEEIHIDSMYIGYDSNILPLRIMNYLSVVFLLGFIVEIFRRRRQKSN